VKRYTAILVVGFLSLVPCFGTDTEKVIIVVNEEVLGSKELRSYYAVKREIPDKNIIALNLPKNEEISCPAYLDTLHNSLTERLFSEGFSTRRKDSVGRLAHLI